MAAILAKKLGMTQLFLEDGTVERVTVLEAGPCPVTGLRMTISRLWVRISKCSRESLFTKGDRMTQ